MHTAMADLYICLGSSLTVFPAASYPESHMTRGKSSAIVNLQRTHLDDYATLRIGAPVDIVLHGVMQELGLEIPPVRDLDDELAARTQRRYAEYGLD